MGNQEYIPLMDDTLKSVPIDKYGMAWGCFCLLGVGLLFPFNCYIAASDYFGSLYPTVPYDFFISLAYNYFQWVLLFVSAYVMPKFSFKSRITIFILAGAAILFFIPFIHMIFSANNTVSMAISLICTFFSGCLASLLFGSVLGLVALFPGEYTGAVMSGNGVAGVIASLLRIITKVSYSDSPSALKSSSFLYFFLGGGLLVICFLCFIVLLQLPITKYYLASYEASKFQSKDSINGSADKKKVSIKELMKKIWREALVVFTIFFTTLSLFPGITSLVQNTGDNKMSQDWFQILFVLFFMIGDVTGRTIPKWFIIFKPTNLWIPTFLRLLFFPLFALCVKPLVFRSDAWYFIFMFIFALSNGYCGTLAMMFGPSKADEHEKEITGIVMSFCLNFGIWISTHFAFLVLYLVTGSTVVL
ncbi:equilibrative nucleoside transporter (ENT) family protein [Tieghemostelium lacteum]|uniref:Equilibrative nucleoside transporter (ENT) family protein n=1 Tax=Tieghemostelium lacteum TaxID=361077 RepID=A0A151ZHH8_TIELA|nr:equilibrative nucleoside transporter (ENT) family protein [Tieghemostelium lacteum]|eukprot:KYQ93369.1 equilibrative nucleoside transporter (ENT) family protein [Tieghemostelium lacteum]